jgi:hypothetical protein
MPTAADSGDRPCLPVWFEASVIAAVAAMAGLGVTGVALAIGGVFSPWWVLATAVPVGIGAGAVAVRSRPQRRPAERKVNSAAVVGLAIAVGLTVWNAGHRAEHLVSDRDPGVYVLTAQLLADTGDVEVHAGVGPFATDPSVDVATAQGFFPTDADAGTLAPQFLHVEPSLLAMGDFVGGDSLMLAVPAIAGGLGLLAVLVLAARFVHPWLAVAAVMALGVSLPQVYFSRDTFSEPFSQPLLAGAVVLMAWAFDRHAPVTAWLAGAVLGAAFATRLDVLIIVAVVPPWLALRYLADRRAAVSAIALLNGLAVVSAIAAIDLGFRSRPYLDLHRSETLSQIAFAALGFVAAGALLVIVPRSGALGRLLVANRRRLAVVASLALLALAGFAWFARPAIEVARETPADAISVYQRAEGQDVEPTRRYYEDSLVWQAWYLGPAAVAAGIAGIAVVTGSVIAGAPRRRDPALLLALSVFAVPTVLYLWRARAFPDHLLVMRRFLPVTLPGMLIAAVGGAGWLIEAGSATRRRRPATVVTASIGALLLAAIVSAPALATWPARSAQSGAGLLAAIDDVCTTGGDDAAWLVLSDGDYDALLPQSLRSGCGQPAAAAKRGIDRDDVARLAAAWAAQGRTLMVLGPSEASVTSAAGPVAVSTFTAPGAFELEKTLTRRPERLIPNPLVLVVGAATSP